METGEGLRFRGQSASQKYNPIEDTKVAGLQLYFTHADDVSSHSLYTRKGSGPHPPPAGTKYEHETQKSNSRDLPNGDNNSHRDSRGRNDNNIRGNDYQDYQHRSRDRNQSHGQRYRSSSQDYQRNRGDNRDTNFSPSARRSSANSDQQPLRPHS